MRLKELMKKTAAIAMSLSVALSSATFFPTDASVVEAAAATSSITVNYSSGTVDLNGGSINLVSYVVGTDTLGTTGTTNFDIVVSKDNGISQSVNDSNISSITTSNGAYAVIHYDNQYSESQLPSGTQNITISSIGTYNIYYRCATNNGTVQSVTGIVVTNDGASSSNGPQLTTRYFKRYGDGIDANFRVSNETVYYEWAIYDKVPSNKDKVEMDSGSGSTSSRNEDFYISSNNLEKYKYYYFWLKVTGDSTKRTYYYDDNQTLNSTSANSYYGFRTMNDDSSAPANGSSGSTSTSGTKKNADGTTTKTTTTTKDGVKSVVADTTGFADGHTEKKTTATPTTSTATWKSIETLYKLYLDGSSTQVSTTLNKDGSKNIKESKTSATGTTTIVSSDYNTAGMILDINTEIDNSEHAVIQTVDYTLSGSKLTVKKITGTKSTVTIPDEVTANGNDYDVTAVAANACKNNKKVKKIVLGDSVKKVGQNAFRNCKNCSVVLINNPLSSVGTNAFKGTKATCLFKIDASTSSYNKTVKRIVNSGVSKKVRFKNI